MTGLVINSVSGFYTVVSGELTCVCKPRGKVKGGSLPLVGDTVEFTVLNDGKGVLEKILPRRNEFIRPAVANIDTLVFLASESIPVTDPFLIDRMSVVAEAAGCEFVLCINKCDLSDEKRLYDIYKKTDISLVETSAETGEGVSELLQLLKGKRCVFTGNSGVGKSSLLNRIIPGGRLEVGELSQKLGRGKHTTRQVSFYNIGDDTYIADTPGFASFDVSMVSDISADELKYCFPEFSQPSGQCRFSDCAHVNEPDCAVLEAIRNGVLPESRHSSYVRIREMIAAHRNWLYD